jgi:hypothetical protein
MDLKYYNLDMIDIDDKLNYYKSYLIKLDTIIDKYSDEDRKKIYEGYKMAVETFRKIKVNQKPYYYIAKLSTFNNNIENIIMFMPIIIPCDNSCLTIHQ